MTPLEQIKCKNLADAIADEVVLTPALYDAIGSTPREIFVPVAARAYGLDAQPIQGNQWISSPLTVAKMIEFLGAAAIFFSSSSCLCWQVGAVRTIGHKFGLKVVKTDASFAVICHLRLEKVTLLVVKFSKIIDPFYRVGDIVAAL